MPDSNKKFIQAVLPHRDELIDRVCNRLQKLSRSHYEFIDYERHHEREEEFLDIILTALQENDYHLLLNYIEQLANKRSNEGYSLEEVQQAISIFEEELWNILTTYQPVREDLVEILHACNQLFGLVKDHMAKIYLEKTIKMQKKLDDLKEKFYTYRRDRKTKET